MVITLLVYSTFRFDLSISSSISIYSNLAASFIASSLLAWIDFFFSSFSSGLSIYFSIFLGLLLLSLVFSVTFRVLSAFRFYMFVCSSISIYSKRAISFMANSLFACNILFLSSSPSNYYLLTLTSFFGRIWS